MNFFMQKPSIPATVQTAYQSSLEFTMNNEADFMSRAGVTAEWDEETCQNYAEWTSGNATYQIWLEDAESIAVKLNMMATKNIGGVAVWRLGYGTQEAWELINAYLQ